MKELSEETRRFVEAHRGEDVRALALQAGKTVPCCLSKASRCARSAVTLSVSFAKKCKSWCNQRTFGKGLE